VPSGVKEDIRRGRVAVEAETLEEAIRIWNGHDKTQSGPRPRCPRVPTSAKIESTYRRALQYLKCEKLKAHSQTPTTPSISH
jgi:hypothetical protein